MPRGTKIAILIVAGVVVIGLILFFMVLPIFRDAKPPVNANANANANTNVNAGALVNRNVPAQANIPDSNVPPPTEVPDATKTAGAARTIAMAFAERLATYDNRHGLKNIDDLRTISTPSVWSYLDGEYRDSLAKTLPDSTDYYAMSSTAIRADLVPADDANVSAVIQMQRVESGTVTNTSFAKLDLLLKKVEGNWLVARLDWEQ